MVVGFIDSFHKMQVICVHSDPLRGRHHDWLRLVQDLLMIYILVSVKGKGEESEGGRRVLRL